MLESYWCGGEVRGVGEFHNFMINSQSFNRPVSTGCDLHQCILSSLPTPGWESHAQTAGVREIFFPRWDTALGRSLPRERRSFYGGYSRRASLSNSSLTSARPLRFFPNSLPWELWGGIWRWDSWRHEGPLKTISPGYFPLSGLSTLSLKQFIKVILEVFQFMAPAASPAGSSSVCGSLDSPVCPPVWQGWFTLQLQFLEASMKMCWFCLLLCCCCKNGSDFQVRYILELRSI